jgi:hypothetical protein
MGIKITVNNYNEIWVYKDSVDAQGLQADQDYTWRYTPAVNDWLRSIAPATVEFEFEDQQWETYFQLRWVK